MFLSFFLQCVRCYICTQLPGFLYILRNCFLFLLSLRYFCCTFSSLICYFFCLQVANSFRIHFLCSLGVLSLRFLVSFIWLVWLHSLFVCVSSTSMNWLQSLNKRLRSFLYLFKFSQLFDRKQIRNGDEKRLKREKSADLMRGL